MEGRISDIKKQKSRNDTEGMKYHQTKMIRAQRKRSKKARSYEKTKEKVAIGNAHISIITPNVTG